MGGFHVKIVTVILGGSILAACGSSLPMSANASASPAVKTHEISPVIQISPQLRVAEEDGATNIVRNPGFETGKLAPWVACGSPGVAPNGHVSTVDPYDGAYDAFFGNANRKTTSVKGFTGICQAVTIPKNAYLSVHLRPVTNAYPSASTGVYVYQFVGLYSVTNGQNIATLYDATANFRRWITFKTSLAKYAGMRVLFTVGVAGQAYLGQYIGMYVDNVSIVQK